MADAEDEWDVDLRLTTSAPPVVPLDDALARDLELVSADARRQAREGRPRRRPLRRRRAVVATAVALSIFGGSVAAVADSGFTWLPWAEDPHVEQSFQLPSGRQCEERIILMRTWYGGDWSGFLGDAEGLQVDEDAVSRVLNDIREPGAVIPRITSSGQLEDPDSPAEPSEDDWYLTARHVAITNELVRAAGEAGLDRNWSSDFQVQCVRVDP